MSELYVTATKKQVDHKEGDVWEEQGKTWTIKNGIKRTVSKLEEARKAILVPMCCPVCERSMKHQLDEQMWAINGTCFNCLIDMEHEIMKAGKWKEYETAKLTANATSFLKDLKEYLDDEMQDTSKRYVTEDGMIEKWKDVDTSFIQNIKDEAIKSMEQTIKNIKNR